MRTISRHEMITVAMYSEVVCESHHAACSVPAHTAFHTIGVVIFHGKVKTFPQPEEHEPIRTDAEATMTQSVDLFPAQFAYSAFAVVNDDEVVAVSMVFVKLYGHIDTVGGIYGPQDSVAAQNYGLFSSHQYLT
jgi:hypothetical protein